MNTKLSDSLVQKHTEQPSLASAQEMARRVQASSSATRSSAKPADEIDTTARGLSMPRAPRRPPCAARASTAAAAQTTATTSNSRPHQIPTQKRKSQTISAYCRGAVGAHCGGPCEAVLPALLVGVRGGIHVPVAIPPPPTVLRPINADRSSSRHEDGQLPGEHKLCDRDMR